MKQLFLGLIVSSSAFAQMNLDCSVNLNNTEFSRPTLTLNTGDRNVSLEAVDGLKLLVTLEKNDMVELQLYNPEGPSRSYSSSELNSDGESVQMTLWERERLLEVKCVRK